MPSDHDFADEWIVKLKAGDTAAADEIWARCFPRLQRFAERRLIGMNGAAEASEEVALSALNSFMRRAQAGEFPRLQQAEELWKLVYRIAGYKAIAYRRKHARHQHTAKTEVLQAVASANDGLQEVMSDLLGLLENDELREIGRLRLFGFNNREIAQKIGRSSESVRRKLDVIRRRWEKEVQLWQEN